LCSFIKTKKYGLCLSFLERSFGDVMNPNNILESVIKLRSELEVTDDIEPEVLEQLELFHRDIQSKINSNELKAEETIFEQLLEMETNFATNHPVLEKLTRDVIDRLSLMGI
jgi:hypothetical protein